MQAVIGRARLFYAAAAGANHRHVWIRQHAVTLTSDREGEGVRSGNLDNNAVKPLGRRQILAMSENRAKGVEACEALKLKWNVHQKSQSPFWSCCSSAISPTEFLRNHWDLEMFEELRELLLTDFGDESGNGVSTHCLEFPMFAYLESG